MRPLLAAAVLAIATGAFYLWLTLVGSQVSPLLLLVVYLIVFLASSAALWRKLLGWRFMTRLAVGATNGFVAAFVSGAVSETWFRGLSEVQERGLDFVFFPSVSLGWLYGAIAIAVITQTRRRGITTVRDRVR